MDPTVHPDGGCGGPLGRANGWISAIAAALRRRPISSAGGPTAARRRAGSRNSSGRRATAGAGNAASLPTAITTGLSRSVVPSASDGNAPPKVGFAEDSPLEGTGFELLVPRADGLGRRPQRYRCALARCLGGDAGCHLGLVDLPLEGTGFELSVWRLG
jgi:hypothetical protein